MCLCGARQRLQHCAHRCAPLLAGPDGVLLLAAGPHTHAPTPRLENKGERKKQQISKAELQARSKEVRRAGALLLVHLGPSTGACGAWC